MQSTKQLFPLHRRAFIAVFALISALFLPASSSFGEEVDSLRIGGDYKFLTLRAGADFTECRRACRKDVSCKAWTFIKERTRRKEGIKFNLGPDLNIGFGGKREIIPPQCRLKHSVGPKHANECCTSGVKRVVQRSRPNKAERCADYAEQALDQQDKNLAQRCRLRGSRWDASYRNHYRWCMNNSKRVANREAAARDDKLRDCRDDRQVRRDRGCDRYASTAMDLLQQARENDCRNTDRDWEDEHERVYQWCLDNGATKRRNVLERAQSKLAACIRRGGGALIERCETYADGALAQIRKSKANQCGNRGQLWRNDFRAQYTFCRKNNRSEARRANDRREAGINRCLRRSAERRVMETGSVEVRQRNNSQWHAVRFSRKFRNPVVIMGPVSNNGADPAHARVRRVTSKGFEFRIEEFGKDGAHARETLSYMVVEKGIHRFNGSVIEAGSITTGADMVNRDWSSVRLAHRWRKSPVVLSQVQTFKGSDPVSSRVKGVSRRGFEVSLSEQESDRQGHARETIAFVAISQGRHLVDGGRDSDVAIWSGRVSRASEKWRAVGFPRRFAGTPGVFARAQTSNGADPFDIRYRRLSSRKVEMRLQEEQSRDRETNHTNEVLGIVAMPFGSYWSDSSRDVDDQVDRGRDRPVRPVEPALNIADCRDYSKRAVSQFKRARRNACRFIGANWHGDAARHRRWCRRNGLAAADRFINRHRTALNDCVDRADEAPVRSNEWVSLGCAKASMKRDRDVISVGRDKGRFSKLQLRVSRAKVKFYGVGVTFGNGKSQALGVPGKISKGAASPPLDLTGNRRFISKIDLRYKTVFKFPPKEATVCVYGQK